MIFNLSDFNSHWQTKKLEQLGTFKRGKSKHRPRNDEKLFENGIHPLIQTGEVKESSLFIDKHTQTYNEFGLKQSKLWDKNTLCITIAANIAETAILKYPMCFPDSIVGFNAYENESSELFMHYVFTYIKKSIQNSASGSIQDNINIDYLTKLKFKIPEKKYQDKIVDILFFLDSKIELNNKINKELESMAKTLYDYWFVQFDFPNENGKPYKSSGGKMLYSKELKREIPDGWEVKNLEEICEIYQPQTISEKEMIKDGKYYVFGANGIVGMYDKYNHEESEVTITCRGNSCGTLNRTLPYSWITGNAMVVKFKDDKIHNEYLMHFLSWTKMDNVITGSAQPQITRTNLAPLKILIPETNILDSFSQKMEFNINLQLKNIEQNQELANLRDWLLPMLMNGQVRVK
jgi:type I restriction enzyme S subunit